MKLIGKLRKQVENASSKGEKREIIAEAGMMLSDDELVQVVGGCGGGEVSRIIGDVTTCELCGNSEPGTVYPLQDHMSGLRIIEYYCDACKQSFGVYV